MYSKDNPIYLQLIENIKIGIINGTFNPGDKLPSIRDFSKDMKVNPNTTQRAYRELELQEFIVSKTGIGYYVNEDSTRVEKLKNDFLDEEIDKFIGKMVQLKYTNTEIIEKVKGRL